MLRFILFLTLINLGSQLWGQYANGKSIPDPHALIKDMMKEDAYLLSTTITEKELKEHVSILASDDFEGRETGTRGNDLASGYISDQFEKLELNKVGNDNTFFQEVAFTFYSIFGSVVTDSSKKYIQLRDFVVFPQYNESVDIQNTSEIIFAGYGIDAAGYSNYDKTSVEGKIVMVYEGEPRGENGKYLLTNTSDESEWSSDWRLKSKVAKKRGASLLMIVSSDFKKLVSQNRRLIINRIVQLGKEVEGEKNASNTIFISSDMAKELIGVNLDDVIAERDQSRKTRRPMKSIHIPSEIEVTWEIRRSYLEGKNVLGFIEGSDKKEEVVIISAHYDHIGKKANDVYNGADDNASGTSTVLEICEALATAKKMGKGPRRSVLCLLVTGEEKGLLGSQYYSENPVFPLDNTMADVNIDMVGRWDGTYEDSRTPYIYVIGSDRLSNDLHEINESVNLKYSGLLLDYKYNDANDPNQFYSRSDHYNFAKHGIPSIFYFNGTHEDYHRITDTIEKIDFKIMTKRARLIFHTVWELANREERLKKNSEGD